MVEARMASEVITRGDIEKYKREMLDHSVLVSTANAARILDCSQRKIRDLVRSGKFPGYSENIRTSGLRILAADLTAYVRSIRVDKDKWYE